ncbi:putative transcriptional regulator [Pseudomonas syringae pv. helianthi]|uniref:Putative transcriptional regulator n=2 Tax=Pseudomonas syringae group TaxID=136849 RepID=A0A0P9W2K8_9PSED|nr:LexA family transcriptional regulator [Pseudomonas syringae group genomosp. 7]KPX44860.1 putative transcriptional regulator [Pseudomonas syringae pv. helianthi]UNB61870.1 LexA family transcriptional regulator [Pseudomonas syringae pv. helianthi]
MSELKVHAIACDIEPMVQIEDIRAAFVARLKKSLSAHGIDQWGAGARLAEIAKVTPKASSKWLNGESMPGPAKMQAIASALGVKIEWLQHGAGDDPALSQLAGIDKPAVMEKQSASDIVRDMLSKQGKGLSEDARMRLLAAAGAEDGGGAIEIDYYRPGVVGDEVWIAHYDVRAAMGGGQIPHDYPEMLQDVRVSPQHLREMGVEFAEHFHLKMVTGWGQSMAPTIKHRDPLLVDISIREFAGDGIYMFSWDGHLYIKRLQWMGDDRLNMISDNTRHPPVTIPVEEACIQARVLLVWNAQLV